jgi:hypothetical protein
VNDLPDVNKSAIAKSKEKAPVKVRLPGFGADSSIGLGDTLKRVTTAIGIRPCGGCKHRAEALNRWIVLTGRERSKGARK